MGELITLEEAADYLRVNKKTIYRLLEAGKIPATRVGRQFRFDRGAIDAWLRDSSVIHKAAILIIDDEEAIRSLFKETLEELGHSVMVAGDSVEGLEMAKRQDYDLVFLDLKMSGMDGAEVFRCLKEVKPKLPVIIITGYPDSDLMARAMSHGPFAVMNKPFNESEIILAVDNFLRVSVQ